MDRIPAALAAMVMALGVAVPAVPAHAAPGTPPAKGPAEPGPVERARREGHRVEVPEQGSQTHRVFANPDGTFTAELHHEPFQVRRGDAWVPIDTTLTVLADGSVAPRASTAGVAFSGGGEMPMATLARDDGRLQLAWPGRLPRPRLQRDTATYPDVWPGVDLELRATATGFAEALVVKNAAAARQPALRNITFGVHGDGMSLATDADGSGTVRDRRGRVVAGAGRAFMWDAGHRRSAMRVTATADSLTVTPDPALLADPGVAYPLRIDPSFESREQHWVMTSEAYPTDNWWDSTDYSAWVGADEHDSAKYYRSYFQLYTAPVAGKHILKATFRATEDWSASCTPSTMQIWWSALIDPSTTWTRSPVLISKLAEITAAKGYSSACPAGDVEAVVTPMLTQIAAGGAPTLTLGLKAPETVRAGAVSLAPASVIVQVDYNSTPDVPTVIGAQDAPGCTATGDVFVPTATPRLAARVSDPDAGLQQNVRATFEWWDAAATTRIGSASTAYGVSGSQHAVLVPAGALAGGATYKWRVRAEDGVDASAWSPWCTFTVDVTAPAAGPSVASDTFPEDGFGAPAYTTGTFTFGAAGVTDVVAYLYDLNSDAPATRVPADGPGGPASVPVTPLSDGPNYLSVASVDRAGNVSPVTTYFFFADAVPGPVGAWSLDESSGTTAADGSGQGRPAGLAGGAGWAAGRHGGGLRLDGTSGAASTATPAVATTRSFTVMAWTYLDKADAWSTAVSQDSGNGSAFELRYNSYPAGWAFVMAGTGGETTALSNTRQQAGVWTHLAGVYDADAGQLRIYVNGRLAGSAPFSGAAASDGPLRIGRANWYGYSVRSWPGRLDDVKVYDRVVGAAELGATLDGDPYGPAGRWSLDEGTGITAADSTGNGNTLGFSGTGVSWTAGRQGGALAFDGAAGFAYTAGPVAATTAGFTAAAWVRLSSSGASATALSQDGAFDRGFSLGYSSASRRWTFAMAATDSPAASPDDTAVSDVVPQLDVWTHLAGVYDAATGQLRLYVNGRLAGTATHPAPWAARGALVVGRSVNNGGWAEFWPGAVDDVRVTDQAADAATIGQLAGVSYGASAQWNFDEGAGTTSADSSAGGQTLALWPGATWTTGAHGGGLSLDGTGGHAYAGGPVLRTDAGFSVAAWVKLTRTDGRFTALSQDGVQSNGFALGYSGAAQRWEFVMYAQDTASSTAEDRLLADVGAQAGTWTHLAAVFDAYSGTTRIYVNGRPAGSGVHTPTWNATGTFAIGRGRAAGAAANFWPGAVDEVRTLPYAATAAEIRAVSGFPADNPTGPVRLRLAHSNLCAGETAAGTSRSVYQGPCAGVVPAQELERDWDGTYRVALFHTTYGAGCMGVEGAATGPGVQVTDGYCADGRGQKFTLEPVALPASGYRIKAVHSGLCLGVADASTASGAPVQQLACSATSAAQIFALDGVTGAPRSFTSRLTVNIADNSATGSYLTVTGVAGNAPANLAVTVNITHTYRGDLVLYLIAPDQTTYLLQDFPDNDSGHDVHAVYRVNASGKAANGDWCLKVYDQARSDVGTIDSWTLTF